MESFIIAERYAQALFNVISKENWDRVVDELNAVDIYIRENADVAKVLYSPVINMAAKKNVLETILNTADFLPNVRRFFYVILEKHRIEVLPYMIASLKEFILLAKHMITADISCSFDVDDAMRQQIVNKVSQLVGRDLDYSFRRDASLLCGIVARVGNTVYDFSIKNKLHKLEKELLSNK